MSEKAETKITEKAGKPAGRELVDFTAPLLPGQEKQDIVVGVNGQLIRIRRGETVRIRPCFVEAIRNADRQQVEAFRASARAQRAEKMYDM